MTTRIFLLGGIGVQFENLGDFYAYNLASLYKKNPEVGDMNEKRCKSCLRGFAPFCLEYVFLLSFMPVCAFPADFSFHFCCTGTM